MKKEDFYFDLPEELIAQDPLEDRSGSRLLVLDKKTGEVEHHIFRDVIDYLNEGDCLVINETKVIPARLFGAKVGTDAKIDFVVIFFIIPYGMIRPAVYRSGTLNIRNKAVWNVRYCLFYQFHTILSGKHLAFREFFPAGNILHIGRNINNVCLRIPLMYGHRHCLMCLCKRIEGSSD